MKKENKNKINLEKETQKKDFAVFDYLNNQFLVSVNDKIFIPLNKDIKNEQEIIFNNVLLVNEKVGTPFVKDFFVQGKCLKNEVKDKKIIVFKYKAKKKYRVKTGHRQKWTMVQILKIGTIDKDKKKVIEKEIKTNE